MKLSFSTAIAAAVAACSGTAAPPMAGRPDVRPGPAAAAPSRAPVARPIAGNPRGDLLPRALLFGNPERTNVQLSPDGTRIAWLAAKDGVLNLWVAPVAQLDQARPITSETRRPITRYEWTFDGAHLVYPQDAGGNESFHLFRAAVGGGEAFDLTPGTGARALLLASSERKPNTIVVAINDRDPKYSDVYAIDLATGKRTLLHANKEGLASFTLDPDLRLRLAAKNEPTGATQMYLRKGNAWVAWDQIPFEDDALTRPRWIDGRGTLYLSDTRGRNTAALYAIDLATRKKTLIAEDASADLSDTIAHPTTRAPQAAAFMYDRTRWRVLDPSIQPDVDGITRLAGGAEWSIKSRSLDDRSWLVVVSSDVAPALYYLWDRTAHAGVFLFSQRPALDAAQLARMHPVILDARDGMKLVSYLTLPRTADRDGDGTPDHPVPMMLWVHGGPWERNRWGYSPYVQVLANRGYAVLQVNFRGSTGFGKAFVNAGDLQWGRKMHDDLIDAVEWAVRSGIAPRDRIAIGGASYGGYATLAGLALTPETFCCGVDMVGPSNLNTVIASIPPYWAPMLAEFKKRIGDSDTPEGKALLEAASPLTHAARIKRPLLIAQGANDPRVKQAESEQIVAAMTRLNLPVSYLVFPDEGHGFARPENLIALIGVMEAFLSAHLGGTYLPLTSEELAASSVQIKEGRRGIPGVPER